MTSNLADRVQMQNRLFAELSAMFGREVPLYDKSLAVNRICNQAVCSLMSRLHLGFAISTEQLDRSSGERHGAIRIGRPDEYRWVGRFFAQFGMEPHNFYDMTAVGARSQPIIATAFRSVVRPEHRVFTSLLMTDWFDADTRSRIERALAARQVFSERACRLIEKGERQGGLAWEDAEALIHEATTRIFKWTATAHDHALYTDLCAAGFKIAADIACFERHHLNHLTPNTFCMDLYVAAMKHVMGQMSADTFRRRAMLAMGRLLHTADRDWLRLHFKHLSHAEIDSFQTGRATEADAAALVEVTLAALAAPEFDLARHDHAGFKDFTEGPPQDTPVLLRQDAYKALTETVRFIQPDGSTVAGMHTARFGEIEERFYATTPAGRELYDRCLAQAEAAREKDPTLPTRDFAAYEALYAAPFASFPKTLSGLLEKGLVFGLYAPTHSGIAARGTATTTDMHELVRQGHAQVEGLRYEDFLPVSAAGIFASNLNQYGTRSTAGERPTYSQRQLEEILGKPIVDAMMVCRGMEAASLLDTWRRLGLLERVPEARRAELQAAVQACPAGVVGRSANEPAAV
jgi:uncharacterized glyoxalase superfamily metalloenzyme YdcJ